MGSVGSKELTNQDIINRIAGEDNYTNDENYRSTAKTSGELYGRIRELDEERRALQDELKNESSNKPREEWTTEDEIMSLLGEKPTSYTERGEEINERLRAISEEKQELEKQWEKSSNSLRKVDDMFADTQKELYKLRPDSERTVSADVKDSYKGFKVGESTTPYIDSMLESGKAFVVEMSPKEYLQECAYNIFDNSTLEKTLRGTSASSVTRYMNMMKKGTKFDTPYLNYRDGEQEGRHRAIAAYLLGYKRIPVIVVRK